MKTSEPAARKERLAGIREAEAAGWLPTAQDRAWLLAEVDRLAAERDALAYALSTDLRSADAAESATPEESRGG